MPFDQVLELALEYAAIENFFDFVLGFCFDNDRTRRCGDLARERIIADGLKKGNMENRVDIHRGWEVKLVSVFTDLLDYRKWSEILVV
jgi:hypothetical protein